MNKLSAMHWNLVDTRIPNCCPCASQVFTCQSAAVAQPVYYSEFSLQSCAAQVRVNKHSKTIFIMKKVIASVISVFLTSSSSLFCRLPRTVKHVDEDLV